MGTKESSANISAAKTTADRETLVRGSIEDCMQ